jgi:MoxR-like ATPase
MSDLNTAINRVGTSPQRRRGRSRNPGTAAVGGVAGGGAHHPRRGARHRQNPVGQGSVAVDSGRLYPYSAHPDILPSDISGTNVFDLNSRTFILKKGPVFTQVLLADEINRTPPKTQAALLEAMEEQTVTLDGTSHPLPDLFWVAATQNPLEFEGTYPLPEAQLDRFLFKLVVDYPAPEAEKQMLLNAQAGFEARRLDIDQLKPIVKADHVLAARKAVKAVTVQESILDYLLALVHKTRHHGDLALGTSPRSAVQWLQASKAHAWLQGQDYVTPDHVKAVAPPLLRHRLILAAEAQLDGLTADRVVKGVSIVCRCPANGHCSQSKNLWTASDRRGCRHSPDQLLQCP